MARTHLLKWSDMTLNFDLEVLFKNHCIICTQRCNLWVKYKSDLVKGREYRLYDPNKEPAMHLNLVLDF